jgi:uncharacterized protein involved in exopolysaccharide biosynthesis
MTQPKKFDPSVHLKEIWQFVLYHKWSVLFGAVLLSTLLVVGVLLFVPTYYMASITVLVDPQRVPSVPEIVTMDQLRFETLSQQILSTSRLLRVIDELHLCDDVTKYGSKQAYVDNIRDHLAIRVKTAGKGNLSSFVIGYKGTDPKIAAQIVSRLANGFMEWDIAARERQADRTKEFLSAEQQQAKEEVDLREAKLLEFKEQHVGELSGAGEASAAGRMQEKLQADAAAIERLEQEKSELERGRESRVQSATAVASPEITLRARLQTEQRRLEDQLLNLRARYSDEHPDVQRANLRLSAIRDELSHLPPEAAILASKASVNTGTAAVEREIERLRDERKRLVEKLSSQHGRDLPLLQAQLDDMTHDYDDARARYISLVGKNIWAKTATKLEEKQEPGRFFVLDPATVPEQPLKSKRALLIIVLVPISFMIAAAGAVGYERLVRGTIATESALYEMLPRSVAILGRIPTIETPGSRRQRRQVATLAVMGVVLCGLAGARMLHKLPRVTAAASGSAVFCVAAGVIAEARYRRPAGHVSHPV